MGVWNVALILTVALAGEKANAPYNPKKPYIDFVKSQHRATWKFEDEKTKANRDFEDKMTKARRDAERKSENEVENAKDEAAVTAATQRYQATMTDLAAKANAFREEWKNRSIEFMKNQNKATSDFGNSMLNRN